MQDISKGYAQEGGTVPRRIKLAYGLGSLVLTCPISAIGFYLLVFYTDVALVKPAIAGAALLIAKIWDGINDPLIGWCSDRSRSSYGRRRVFIRTAFVPLALTLALLWFVPSGLGDFAVFAWILVSYMLFDTFLTMVQVPFSALAAELTSDYDERTSLALYSSAGAILGYVCGSIGTRLISMRFVQIGTGYACVGAALGIMVGLGMGFVLWQLRDLRERAPSREPIGFRRGLRAIINNHPFLYLLAAFAIVRLGLTLVQTSLIYFVTYVVKSPQLVTSCMLTLMVTVALCVPVWKKVCDHFSKGLAYAAGLAVVTAPLVSAYWLEAGHETAMLVIVALSGIGLSAHWVVPWAMLPDVVEYDEMQTGDRREGLYYGVYGVVDKLARALGVFLVAAVLQSSGYVAQAEQTDSADFGMRLLFALLPAALLLLAAAPLIKYPVNREAHAGIRRKLAVLRGESTS